MQQLRAGQQGGRLFRSILLPLPLALQSGNHLIELPLTPGSEQGLGVLEDAAVQPQSRGNGQGIAAPRDSPLQVVGRREALNVEGDGGVLEARVVVLKRLELPEVGRSDGQPRPIGQLLEQGDGQRRALGGIGASPHLIKEHQLGTSLGGQITASGGQRLKDPGDPPHMATEGGEVLLQGLLIADVRENLLAPGQPR